jgi:hypothetical protein
MRQGPKFVHRLDEKLVFWAFSRAFFTTAKVKSTPITFPVEPKALAAKKQLL